MKMLLELHFPSGKSGNEEEVLNVIKAIQSDCQGRCLVNVYREDVYNV
jgi:hypothetical protein